MIKKASISIFSLLLLFLASKEAYAQTFNCTWIGGETGCVVDTGPVSDPDCDYNANGPNQAYCQSFGTDEECEGTAGYCQTCLSPSFCASSCGDGSAPAEGTCAAPGSVCCIADDEEPPPAEVCYRCVVDAPQNYCVAVAPPNPGDCTPYYTDSTLCDTECDEAEFTSFTCIPGDFLCEPAPDGEFQGPNAYDSCLEACQYQTDIEIFCDQNGNPTTTPTSSLYTAIGCVPVRSNIDFAIFLLQFSLGIGSGVAFLMILYAGFIFLTSGGDPEKVKMAKNIMISAISGLLLIIFSVYLLKVVGIDILQIPEF